jgi:nucleoside-diphosphate-sugar epimerase
MKFDNVLVTGGSGLLGRYVTAEVARHTKISVLDLSPPAGDVPFHRADITDREAVATAMAGHDAVIHLAALDQAVAAPEHRFFNINVMGLWNVLEAAEAAGVRRAVICSSVAAVALSRAHPPRYLPVDIAHPCNPTVAYGLSKQVGETIGRMFARRGGLTVCALRPTWVVHPEFAYDIARKVAAEDGGPPPPPATHASWRNDHEPLIPSRTFVTPDDAARAFRLALEAETGPFDAFFVTARDSFSPRPTVEVVRRSFGVDAEIRDPDLFERDPRASLYEIGRSRELLGWEPQERWADLMARVLKQAGGRA